MSRPVLMTVDDDPGVSRAVARDLRRRYGEEFRVVRAESGADALDALRELTLRGEPTAAILADYRMPGMNGVEFLEAGDGHRAARPPRAAHRLRRHRRRDPGHQRRRRRPLPAQAVGAAGGEALPGRRRADRDLARRRRPRPSRRRRSLGHRWSAESFAARDFLARNSVPYRWYNIEEPDGARLLDTAGATADDVPVLVTPDGTALLKSPSEAEIAAAVGLTTTPTTDFYDLIVIGGGPAGLGSAVYGASEGLRTVLVERQATGGQAGQSSRIENYLGFPDGVSGAQLTDRARRQAAKFGTEVLTARDVVGLEARGSARVVKFGDGTEIAAHSVVLATGVSYRALDAAGRRGPDRPRRLLRLGLDRGAHLPWPGRLHRRRRELRGPGRGVLLPAREDRDAAGARAVARGVDVVLPDQAARGDRQRRASAPAPRSSRPRATSTSSGSCCATTRPASRRPSTAGPMFIFIGAAPRTEWLDGVVVRDSRGFVRTGPDLMTEGKPPAGWPLDREPYYLESSIPGVFVAGDVRADSVKRVASAVGEGAMAVTLVHRYLEEQ